MESQAIALAATMNSGLSCNSATIHPIPIIVRIWVRMGEGALLSRGTRDRPGLGAWRSLLLAKLRSRRFF
jgi:hypothetical protein